SRARFEEIHDAVIHAWTTGDLGFEGTRFQVPSAALVPRPLQVPHPPVWVSAMSPASVAWCARHDYPAMQVAEPLSVGEEHLRRYRAAALDAGVEIRRGGIVPLRYVFVAESDEAAREACHPHIKAFWSHFTKLVGGLQAYAETPGYEYWAGE